MGKKKDIYWNRYVSFSFLLRIVMIVSLFLALWKKDYVWVVGTFIGFFISILPIILKKDIKFSLPWVLDLLIALVTILFVGGRLLDYDSTIPGYQLITRFFMSLLVAFIGLAVIYVLDEHWNGLKMDKYAMGFLTVIFTMSMGVFLEFVKWLNITGIYYIRTNHVLMLNLSADTVAGIIIAVIGMNLIKTGKFDKMTDDFGNQIDKMVIERFEKKSFK